MSKASAQRVREQAHFAAERVNLERAEAALRDQRRWRREKGTAPAAMLKEGGRTSSNFAIVNPEFVKTGRIEKSFPSNKNLILRSTESKGFSNTGSWRCYWNSMLQVLLHAPPVYHLLGNFHRNCGLSVRTCVACALQQLSQQYWNGGRENDRLTRNIHRAVKSRLPTVGATLSDYHSRSQNDSAVYLDFILEELQQFSNGTQRASVEKVFYFHSQQYMDCVVCSGRSTWAMNHSRLGFFFNLRRPVEPEEEDEGREDTGEEEQHEEEQEVEQEQEQDEDKEGEEDAVDDESVEAYIRAELKEQQRFTCNSAFCQNLRQDPDYELPIQTRHTRLHYCPDVLIIQIGRFGSNAGQKILTDSDFPEEINIGRYTTTPAVPVWYRFSGLVAHQGKTTNHGHYISVVRHPDQSFRIINDDDVRTTMDFDQNVKTPGTSDHDRFQPSVLCYTRC